MIEYAFPGRDSRVGAALIIEVAWGEAIGGGVTRRPLALRRL
jgi:hypothetical protein